jgi:hypothetical protein
MHSTGRVETAMGIPSPPQRTAARRGPPMVRVVGERTAAA